MNNIKFSNQPDVMAIINRLYQEPLTAQEHLDRTALEQNMTQQVIDYYQSTGIPVDYAVIQRGIEQWFKQRLSLQRPKVSKFSRSLAMLYISRIYWAKPLLISFIIAGVIVGGYDFWRSREFNQMYQLMTEHQKGFAEQSVQLAVLKRKMTESQAVEVRYANNAINRRYAQLSAKIHTIETLLNELQEHGTRFESIEQGQLKDREFRSSYLNTDVEFRTIDSELLELRKLQRVDKQASLWADNDYFATALTRYPILADNFNNLLAHLDKSDTLTHQVLQDDIKKIEYYYAMVPSVDKIREKIDSSVAELQRFKLPKDEMDIITNLHQMISHEMGVLNMNEIKELADKMDYYVRLARTPLTLRIIDRTGEKSWVERTNRQTDQKSWYLVVEAIAPMDDVHNIMIENAETGKIKIARTFAIEVSEAEYNKVRKDKNSDGRIDRPLVGRKPAGRLTFNYSRPVLNGMLTEW